MDDGGLVNSIDKLRREVWDVLLHTLFTRDVNRSERDGDKSISLGVAKYTDFFGICDEGVETNIYVFCAVDQ